MAVKPTELALTMQELDEATKLESKVDQELREKFVIGRAKFQVYIGGLQSHLTSQRVMNEVKRRYEGSGWKRVDIFDGNLRLEN